MPYLPDGPRDCCIIDNIAIRIIELDKETAIELLEVLNHQFIDYEFTKVHELIKRLQEFVK